MKYYDLGEISRLARAVCEYENIVHILEQELREANQYKDLYMDLLSDYSEVVKSYNELVDEYNALI